jgi:hypothetical protein
VTDYEGNPGNYEGKSRDYEGTTRVGKMALNPLMLNHNPDNYEVGEQETAGGERGCSWRSS